MSYNYPQTQYQAPPQQMGYGGYRPATQYPAWGTALPTSMQVRPVSSVEEVKACPIDFDGSVFYFTDVANKRIYTKQINLDGTVLINLYELKTDQTANALQYITRQEFEEVINKLYDTIKPTEAVQSSTAQSSEVSKAQFEF